MNDGFRDLIDRHWRELESERVSTERRLRIAELPFDGEHDRPAAAVDYEGHRHFLVPIASHQSIRRGLDGPVLLLRKRPLEGEDTYQVYADLGCLRPDMNDLFTMLCADVLRTTESMPHTPLKALYKVLDRWKALFQNTGARLGPEQLAGLFGELTVLVRLLEKDSSAHRLWRGPHGHRHDFSAATVAVEVKSTTAGDGRRVRIHGLEQLDAPVEGTLALAWFRLERSSELGEGILQLIERALRLCDDETALLNLLAVVGLRPSDAALYQDFRFRVVEERWYLADTEFPKLTSNDLATAGIRITVTDVAYTVDLSNEPPSPLEATEVNEHLSRMIREPS
ncbi:PD-(D/E)XK motif protein [Nonomuraea sp. NPDC049504]|uniref:PD-(D/E)XK motif protein n=1 Tax=Nonomuraea sp. NPDC049504 TaxID=3154729 RepID=UPI00342B57A3